MNRNLKWMLLGIFLGIAATWCMFFATNGASILPVLGCYALPVVSVICFATGFTGVDDDPSSKNTDVPKDTENKE